MVLNQAKGMATGMMDQAGSSNTQNTALFNDFPQHRCIQQA